MRVTVHLTRSDVPLILEGIHRSTLDDALQGLRNPKPFVIYNLADEWLIVRRDMVAHVTEENESDTELQRIAKVVRVNEAGEAERKLSAKVHVQWAHKHHLFAWKVSDVSALVSSFMDGGHARREPLRLMDVVTQRVLYLPDRSCVCWIRTETQLDEHKS